MGRNRRYTQAELEILEDAFLNRTFDPLLIEELAIRFGVEGKNIQRWFTNRKTKEKKINSENEMRRLRRENEALRSQIDVVYSQQRSVMAVMNGCRRCSHLRQSFATNPNLVNYSVPIYPSQQPIHYIAEVAQNQAYLHAHDQLSFSSRL